MKSIPLLSIFAFAFALCASFGSMEQQGVKLPPFHPPRFARRGGCPGHRLAQKLTFLEDEQQ
eukprot:3360605-Amphidinium_carterae.1